MGTEHKLTVKLLSDAVEAGVRVQRGWWHEVVYRFPRSAYKMAAAEDEMKSSGVYFLLGEIGGKPSLYVGQTTNLSARFAQHAVDGSKGFWQDTLVLTTSGGATLDEAHLKYLENHFYCIAAAAGRCSLTNSSVPPESVAVDAIRQDMDECIAHTRLLLNLMGYHFLERQTERMDVKPQPEKKPALPVAAEMVPVEPEPPQRLAGDVVCAPSALRAPRYDFYVMGLKDGDVLVYEDADPTHRMEVTVCGPRLLAVKGERMTPHKLVKAMRKVDNVYAFDYLSRNGEKLRSLYNRIYHAAEEQGAKDNKNLRYCSVAGADARGRLNDGGGITVLAGSRIGMKTGKSCPPSVVALRERMCPDGVLKQDVAFGSLSGAAQFVGGCALNGKKYWTETKKILPKPRRKKA